ncbi:anti-sigma factor family protein [Rubrivivax sp. A210]|uniref:anti-sigma factor family protein n=1 Tax=Rubrivivax sp. A210 TaxID=2772301 RepID=UPI001918A9B0|nr:anti-sigma factor [Rubrivivax sp. A210]
MSSTERINDEELSAWVDGELDAGARQRVDAWLQTHPDDAARVRRWEADRDALRELFAAPVVDPVPPRLHNAVWRPARTPRWALAAAAAGLLVAGALAGGAGIWRWQQQEMASLQVRLAAGTAQGWVRRAALAHSVYTIEPRHAVEVKAQEEHLARWLTRRIEVPVKLFDLHAQGWDLVGGRLLPDGPGKSAQLMYQDGKGQRVTVYLRKPEVGAETAFRYEQQGELGLFYWVEEGAGYALVGKLPRATLLALAEAIYQQQTTPAPAPPAPAVSAPTS